MTELKELSAIFLDAITKTTELLTSSNPSNTKLSRVREPPLREESHKAVEATRVSEVQVEIRTSIQTERWKQQLSTHIYPTQVKALTVQEIVFSELLNIIEISNYNRVYPLSETATNEYINAILTPSQEALWNTST